MAKFAFQENVIYSGVQFPDYAGEPGMVTEARETHQGVQYLVLLDNGAQILVPEDDLTLPDTPREEISEPKQDEQQPTDHAQDVNLSEPTPDVAQES